MCDHREKEHKHGKINRSKSQQMKQHHQNQGQHGHHYHHQSDHNNGQDFHSAEHIVGDPQPNHRPQRDDDETHPPHHYRHKLKHRCVSSSSSSSTSSSSSSSTSSSTSSPSSSSSSLFSSSSVTSNSSSSLSTESSSDCSERHPEHSQSCTDITGKQRYLEEGDDTAPLIDKESDLNRTYPKQKRKIGKSSHRGSTKGALKNKGTNTRNLGYDGSFRKAKSMEELPASKDRRRNGNMENDQIKTETKKNLMKEKMKFSAFLNEITRQVLSPMRLTSLGVTDAQRPCSPGQVSARSRETDSSTEKPKQQRSRPTSPDSVSSSKRSSGSKHSRSSRLSQYEHFQHHGNHHSNPPHNVKHRSRSCNSSFPTSEHHSHLPSHKRHHHHHTSSHHHHHHPEDHNSPIHHHHHRVHHTTSHKHQHRDNHTMSHHHHHGHHHSPVSQHGGHHSSTQHNKQNENRLQCHHYGEDHPGDCCKLTHHHGEQHSDIHIHAHQSHTDDLYREAHHDHAQHHGDSFNPTHHHEGHQIIPHHHEGHHSSVQHQNPHPKSRPTTPHHHEYHSPTSDYSDHHSPTHHPHGHHHKEAYQHHHGDHRSGPHNLHHGDHHSLGHHCQHGEYSAEAHRHHHGDHHSPSSHHHSQQHNKESQEHNEDHYGTGNCDEDHKSEIHGHHHRDHNNPGHYQLHHHGDHHKEVHHHRHGHCHNDPHDNHHSEAQHPHGDYHSETHHHPQEDHHSEAHHHHHGDHPSPGHNHSHGDHHSKSHHHHHGNHHSEVHHQPHGGPHSPDHHHGSYHSEAHPRPHGDHHREDHRHHHGDHHSPGHHHGDQQNRAHQHHHGEPHSGSHQDHHEIHHTEAHWHGGHHSPGHHHHHGDHLSSGNQHHNGDQRDSGHQHHHGDYHNTSHHQGHHPESKPHPNQSKMNDVKKDSHNEHIYSRGNSASSPVSHRKQESLVSKLDAPRQMIIPFSQDEEQTSFPSPSTHKEKADDLGKIMILQDENEGLHQSLLKTAVRMECLGEEFISSQKLLETELHRTRIELSDLMNKFKRLHDDCSTTQQTNNLLEQKLHSVTQNMEEERVRLNRRISELTEQLTSANSLETLTVTSVLHKTNLHSLSDDAVTEFVSSIPPPPAQFMDSPKYRKDKTGQELPLGSVPEEEESDWSEMGEETPRLILTGSNRVWRNQEADMDKDSESGGEDFVRGPSPRPLQIPHLQFTLHNDFMSPSHINPSSSGFKKFSDIIPDEKSHRIATNANFKSTILIRSASLEEIPQARHHVQKELRGTGAMMNLHHSEDEAIEDLNNEIIHHWRMSDDRDTVVRLTKSREPEMDSSLASLHSAEQMLSHLICHPPSGEGQDPGRAEVHGWVGGIPEEVLKGERTQL